MSVIVWEWSDSGNWFPYKAKVSNFIEGLYQKYQLGHTSNSQFVQLGTVDWEMSVYEVDVCTLQQRRMNTGMLRNIRRTERPQNGFGNDDATWEWREGNRWTPYDPVSNKMIEQSYKRGINSQFPLSSRYSVELQPSPIQINNQTGFRREIRRQKDKYLQVLEHHQGSGNVHNGYSHHSVNHQANGTSSVSSKSPSSPKSDAKARKTTSSFHESPKIAKADNKTSLATCSSTTDQEVFISKIPKRIKFDYCLKPFKKPEEKNEAETEDVCPICLLEFDVLFEEYLQKGQSEELSDDISVTMPCGHPVHLGCAYLIYKNDQEKYLKCPVCKKIFAGILTGTQPVGGRMEVRLISQACAGYEGYQTHEIIYHIPYGTQGPEHPNPGRPYHASGFPRTAYLPATEEGNLIVKMLQVAFERRLIFTVGTSHTTGLTDAVVWSSVHHKTSLAGFAHSYPDPNHLAVLKQELNDVNVFETDVQ